MADLADIIGSTGFNYTQRWGSKRGQKGNFNIGSRPPRLDDWEAMSQEERDAVGVPDYDTWKRAQDAWLGRHDPGGDIANERVRAAEAIQRSGATDPEGVRQALLGAGFTEEQDGNLALFKELIGAMKGEMDASGRYHWTPSGWADVATSDLSKRGIGGASDYNGPHLFGLDALRAAGSPLAPAFTAFDRFKDWNRGAGAEGGKGAPGAGLTPLGGGFYRAIHGQLVDDLGFVYDPNTKQRTGHYIPGSHADLAFGGRGMTTTPAPVDWTGGGTGVPTPATNYAQFAPIASAMRPLKPRVQQSGMASTANFGIQSPEPPLFGPDVLRGPIIPQMQPFNPKKKIKGSVGKQGNYALPALGG